MKRKKYDEEFKRNCLREWRDSGMTGAEASVKFGVNTSQLYLWRNAYKNSASNVASDKRKPEPEVSAPLKTLTVPTVRALNFCPNCGHNLIQLSKALEIMGRIEGNHGANRGIKNEGHSAAKDAAQYLPGNR